MFAAIEPLSPSKTKAATELATRAFRRFPLPPEGLFAGGVVEFQQLFAMAGDGVVPDDGSDPRVVALDQRARLQMEIRWNAYAVRRGPLAHIDNAEKLARLLAGNGDQDKLSALRAGDELPAAENLEVAKAVAEALGAAWNVEGAAMTQVSEAHERGDPPDAVKAALSSALEDMAARTQRARALLDNL